MKLQILIPQWNETDKEVKPLLDSIAIQQNVDFDEVGVIIVNDGSDTFLSDEFLNSYPFKIDYYKVFPYALLDLDGNIIKKFINKTSIAKYLHIDLSTVTNHLENKKPLKNNIQIIKY